MKRILKTTLYISYVITVLVTVMLAQNQSTEAAAARCFAGSLTGDSAFRELSCDGSVASMIKAAMNEDPQADQCYLMAASGWGVNEKQPQGSEKCNAWVGKTTDPNTGGAPPSCAKIDGTIKDYQTGKVTSNSQIHPVACDQALTDELKKCGFTLRNLKCR